jgi:acetyltransferase-like isoleucine patch superfamily enzyme
MCNRHVARAAQIRLMSAREFAKAVGRGAALVGVLPKLLSYSVSARVLGADRALQGATQSLSRIAGFRGEYLRRAFLMRVLDECHPATIVGFGTVFSRTGARIEEDVYVGLHCHLGLVTLQRGALISDRVQIPSGAHIHGSADVGVPIREQSGHETRVTVGAGAWIGTGAIVMANVGVHSIVAAGAVVTHPVPDYVIVAGVPARVVRRRTDRQVNTLVASRSNPSL